MQNKLEVLPTVAASGALTQDKDILKRLSVSIRTEIQATRAIHLRFELH